MSNNPFFSIIIPTYNRTGLIEKTIRSVLNQTFKDFEVIIVDDGSTDDTKEIINSINDDRINYYYIENSERAAARNYGIKKAKGKYITFLDSDDLLFENHFEEAKHFIDRQQPLVFHQQYQIKNGDKEQKVEIKLPIQKALIKGNPLSCMGIFIKKENALQNLFNEDRVISGSEDYEIWLRCAAKFKFIYNPVCTSTLITHDDRSVFTMDIEKLIIRKLKMLEYAFQDTDIEKVYGKHRNTMYANAYSYIALHIALTKKHKGKSFQYLWKSIYTQPKNLFQKRNLAIIKYLLR